MYNIVNDLRATLHYVQHCIKCNIALRATLNYCNIASRHGILQLIYTIKICKICFTQAFLRVFNVNRDKILKIDQLDPRSMLLTKFGSPPTTHTNF